VKDATICGFTDITVLNEFNYTTFEICAWWGSKKSIPLNWDPKKQMALANIEMSL